MGRGRSAGQMQPLARAAAIPPRHTVRGGPGGRNRQPATEVALRYARERSFPRCCGALRPRASYPAADAPPTLAPRRCRSTDGRLPKTQPRRRRQMRGLRGVEHREWPVLGRRPKLPAASSQLGSPRARGQPPPRGRAATVSRPHRRCSACAALRSISKGRATELECRRRCQILARPRGAPQRGTPSVGGGAAEFQR